jgi:hypothetical protein
MHDSTGFLVGAALALLTACGGISGSPASSVDAAADSPACVKAVSGAACSPADVACPLGCGVSADCSSGVWAISEAPCVDACPGLGCAPQCPNGILKDSNGCDTCQCAPADAGTLQWYTTCGYIVCGGSTGDAGVLDAGPVCPATGTPCSDAGDTCGVATAQNCGVTMVCAPQDPKGPNGDECPVSSRKYKNGIAYVNGDELQRLHDEALGIRLATYQYKPQVDDPRPTHLGFIVEDNLQSPAVDVVHSRVDMYGYLSMVVAAMQVQEKEIAGLRKDLEAARHDLETCKEPRR